MAFLTNIQYCATRKPSFWPPSFIHKSLYFLYWMAHFFPDRYNISLQIYNFFYSENRAVLLCQCKKQKLSYNIGKHYHYTIFFVINISGVFQKLRNYENQLYWFALEKNKSAHLTVQLSPSFSPWIPLSCNSFAPRPASKQ